MALILSIVFLVVAVCIPPPISNVLSTASGVLFGSFIAAVLMGHNDDDDDDGELEPVDDEEPDTRALEEQPA